MKNLHASPGPGLPVPHEYNVPGNGVEFAGIEKRCGKTHNKGGGTS